MDPFDEMSHPYNPHAESDFAKGFTAVFVGSLLGASLNNTRFGRWFNTSKLVGFIFKAIFIYGIYLVLTFIYEVIKVW